MYGRGLGSGLVDDLLDEGAAVAQEYSARGGQEQAPILVRDKICSQNENIAGGLVSLVTQA